MINKKYGVILADPPWKYSNSNISGSAENKYSTMTDSDLCNMPIKEISLPDSVLILWATWPKLKEAIALVDAWGFEYVTGLPWIKIIGQPSFDLWGLMTIKAQYGVGFWFRGCTEPILIGRRGKAKPPDGDFVGLISENLKHSRKPENLYHIAERMSGPYLELFARRTRKNWDVFGNEVEGSIDL